jgi:hypothetical protein
VHICILKNCDFPENVNQQKKKIIHNPN